MAKKKEEIVEEVVETPEVKEEPVINEEPKQESLFKRVLGEVKAFLIIMVLIGLVGLGTWYWYTHVYDGGKSGNKETTTKDGNIYSYASKESHIDLSVVGNYLVERNDSFVTKIMDLKTEVLYEGKIECNSFAIGQDNNLYFILSEYGEDGNEIILYRFDGEDLEELDPISKLGVYFAPLLLHKGDNNILLGFAGTYYTQDDFGDDDITTYIEFLDGKELELKGKELYGNYNRLDVESDVITSNEKYIITYKAVNDKRIFGLYDYKEGKDVFEPSYEELKEIGNDTFVAQKNGKAGIIDTKRKILVDFKYDYIDVRDGFFAVVKNNKIAIMDNKYKLITDFVFDTKDDFYFNYYLCCANYNSMASYKIGNKYVLITNIHYEDEEGTITYLIGEDGKYERVNGENFVVNDGLIYSVLENNKFVIYNDNLLEKYTLDLTRYDFDIFALELINDNTIVALADKSNIYVDYETGEEIEKAKEFDEEIDGINLNYYDGKLTIKENNIEKSFDISEFDYSSFKKVDNGYYYISESDNNSIYIFVLKEE